MSRIGKQLIRIPTDVTVDFVDGCVRVKGPKGELQRKIHSCIQTTITDGALSVTVKNPDDQNERSLWGTFGSHIKNMIQGVTKGFSKQLEIQGVGFKVALQGQELRLEVGFSHPVIYTLPKSVTGKVEKNVIILESSDVELLGQTAAEIRAVKKPEPYKGKGIRYSNEIVRRKAGKAAKAAA